VLSVNTFGMGRVKAKGGGIVILLSSQPPPPSVPSGQPPRVRGERWGSERVGSFNLEGSEERTRIEWAF